MHYTMISISPSNYIIENNYNQHFYKFNLKITQKYMGEISRGKIDNSLLTKNY